MVQLYLSLLAVALATGPALALPSKYQRRNELDSNLYRREFVDNQDIPFTREDHEDLYAREAFDDLEAREPFGFGLLLKVGEKVAEKVIKHTAKHSVEHAVSGGQSNDQHDDGHHHHDRRDLEELYGRDFAEFLQKRSRFGGVAHAVHTGLHLASKVDQAVNEFQSRDLEHDEELFGRGLDADIFDDLD